MMRKSAPRIALFLVLGGLVNVAVAWSCAYFVGTWEVEYYHYQVQGSWNIKNEQYRGTVWSFSGVGSRSWYLPLNNPYYEEDWVTTDGSDVFPRWSRLPSPSMPSRVEEFGSFETPFQIYDYYMYEQAHGWPLLTAHCDWLSTHVDVMPRLSVSYLFFRKDELRGGLDLRILGESKSSLSFPLRPPDEREGWYFNHSVNRDIVLPFHPIWSGLILNTLFYAVLIWGVVSGPGAARRAFRKHRNRCPACGYPIGTSIICTECGCQLVPPTR